MITTAGKRHIKQYLAGQVPAVARAMSLGIGDTAASLSDQKMAFETLRLPLDLVSYDVVNDKLIFKAVIPDTYVGKVYEIGLWSLEADLLTEASNRILTTFDQVTETWSAGTWTTANTRVGADSLNLAPATSATVTAALDVSLDLTDFSPSDGINLAYNNGNSNASSVRVRFKTDSSNYFTGVISAPTVGYKIGTILKSAFTATGTPDWGNINTLEVEVLASGAGAASVDFDALSFVDLDFANPDYVQVAREVITPFTKVGGTVNEVEFSLSVSV